MKRTVNAGENEPDQKTFDIPSEKEHLFQVTDVFTNQDETGVKLNLDDNTVSVKCEVVGGDEAGRNILQRCSLDDKWKGFFATRLFLKAIGESYKGDNLNIDTDRWVGRQFYATVTHAEYKGKNYPNISEYNFDKVIEQPVLAGKTTGDIAWEE